MNSKIGFLYIAALLFTACNVSNQASEGNSNETVHHFGYGIDSVKVEVSTKVNATRSIIIRDSGMLWFVVIIKRTVLFPEPPPKN